MPAIKSSVVQSIETYEQLKTRYELYECIKDGIQDINEGKTQLLEDAISDIKSRRKR